MTAYTWGYTPPPPTSPPFVSVDDTGTGRQLQWEMSVPSPSTSSSITRVYRHDDGLEITVNAQWDGVRWAKDVAGPSSRTRFETSGMSMSFHPSSSSPFSDSSWSGSFDVSPNNSANASINSSAELEGPGQTEAFVAQQCRTSTTGNTNIGSGCTFRKQFPATPSSITITNLFSSGTSGTPNPFSSRAYGTGVYSATTASGNTAYFYARVQAS